MARNRLYLYGKNSVFERLKADPCSIRQVFIQDNFRASHIVNLLKAEKIPTRTVSEKELLKIKRADRLQGIVAEVGSFRYTDLEKLLDHKQKQPLSLILLDGLNDPHNLGSIIRIAACFGNLAIVIPGHASVEVNETAIHVASGGENFVAVAKVTNLTSALLKARKAGYWTAGTVVEGGEDINRESLPFPLCLVLGSEGKGIRPGLRRHLDLEITLPMKGADLSLNVAMTFAILAHEITRHRDAP